MAFAVQFSPRARDNLKTLRKRDQQIILDAVAAQLIHQADSANEEPETVGRQYIGPLGVTHR
jgi:mRNA-degrading endonuclease RelE of RelBE toxin-antitoxin system